MSSTASSRSAAYLGDDSFVSSISASIYQVVSKYATALVLQRAPNPARVGEQIVMTATVANALMDLPPLPTARNDAASLVQGHAANIAPLANDLDPAGGGLMVVRVEQPTHGRVTIDDGAQTVTYTPELAFSGVNTFTYTLQDANGNGDVATVIAVVAADQGAGAPVIVPIDPTQPVQAVITGTHVTVTLQTPARVYTGTLTEKDLFYLVHTPILTPTGDVGQAPGGLHFGNYVFHLDANFNDTHLAGLHFGEPITLATAYDPALLGGLEESTLTVYYWDGTAWAEDGITVVIRDTVNHVIVLRLAHLSEFAFFASAPTASDPTDEPVGHAAQLYLPAIAQPDVRSAEEVAPEADRMPAVPDNVGSLYLPTIGR